MWKQVVTDGEGRRRFHGAFTGGFSAGYFNTVGSREGWTPQTFSSSRDSRATPRQTAEDFMDEEDRAMGVTAKLSARAEYGLLAELPGGEKEGSGSAKSSSLEHAMSQMLERAPDEKNVGLKLMRQMGWVDGTGCGALVRSANHSRSRQEPASQPTKRVAGPALSREEIDEIRFAPTAPRDVGVFKYVTKDNAYGVGYDAFTAAPEFAAAAVSKQDKPKKRLRIGGDEEDEDECGFNPFAADDDSQYDRVLGVEQEKKSRAATASLDRSGGRRCSDGRAPLKGFVLGSVWVDSVASVAPPVKPPRDWKPSPPASDSLLVSSNPSLALAQWAMAAAQKAMSALLTKQQARVMAAPVDEKPKPELPPMSEARNIAQPFSGDRSKQHRYQNWLLSENGLASVWKNSDPPTATEIEEFQAVKSQWSAVPAGMADRFAPAGHEESAVKDEAQATVEEFQRFGAGTTRFEEDWAPATLLCRRWGLKDPNAGAAKAKLASVKKQSGPVDLFPALTVELEKQFGSAYKAQMQLVETELEERAQEEAQKAKLQNPEEQVAPVVRPSKDVFDAIFGAPSVTVIQAPALDPPRGFEKPLARSEPIDVDSLPVKNESSRREPAASDALMSLFGGDAGGGAEFGASQGAVKKRPRTLDILEKSPFLQSWVSDSIEKEKKKKKKKHKSHDGDKDKKGKKKDQKKKKGKKNKKRKADADDYFHI